MGIDAQNGPNMATGTEMTSVLNGCQSHLEVIGQVTETQRDRSQAASHTSNNATEDLVPTDITSVTSSVTCAVIDQPATASEMESPAPSSTSHDVSSASGSSHNVPVTTDDVKEMAESLWVSHTPLSDCSLTIPQLPQPFLHIAYHPEQKLVKYTLFICKPTVNYQQLNNNS